jgi:multiple sugar transport system ATP-binding protein
VTEQSGRRNAVTEHVFPGVGLIMQANKTGIRVKHLRKSFRGGSVVACDDVNLEIAQGELLVLLGPSGCGKTTTLRCIAGLDIPDRDDAIWVNGRNMTRVLPKDRNLAFVFQETALFPNLTVRRNMSFGLDMRRGIDRREINRRVEEAARMLQLEHLLDRYPRELSGGQGQRVALGRAIVMEPDAFLLDEPLAALDAALRAEMRTEIKLIQRNLNATMIFVTHDQEEALTIGDRIAVLKDGVVQQVDTSSDIYLHPANLFVGTFIGAPPINQFTSRPEERNGETYLVSSLFGLPAPPRFADGLARADGTVTLGLRPEFITIGGGPDGIAGRVTLTELMGSRTLIIIDCKGQEVRVLIQGDTGVREGESVNLSLQLDRAFYFGEDGMNLF